jgi:Icc-related predicted phosphoesterase
MPATPSRLHSSAVCAGANYGVVSARRASSGDSTVRIIHVSDTHNTRFADVPSGDILVHSGDMVECGTDPEFAQWRCWLHAQPHKHKVLVCGNHEEGIDQLTDPEIRMLLVGDGFPDTHILRDSSVTLLGLRFFGSPWNNSTGTNAAYAIADDDRRASVFLDIMPPPGSVDVLITHNPPLDHLDLRHKVGTGNLPCELCDGDVHKDHFHWGCPGLLKAVKVLRPRCHLFGHVHSSPGVLSHDGTLFSNAAMYDHRRPSIIDVTV